MRSFMLFVPLLAFVIIGCREHQPIELAPDLEGKQLDGKHFKLSDFKGKVVLVDFFAEWCGPCKKFYPRAQKLAKSYQGRAFVLLGIDADTHNAACRRWEVQALPTIFLIDANGFIRKKFEGLPDLELENLVDELVKEAETKA